MSEDLAVHARKLRRTFGAFVAVDDIDLEVPRGSIYGFLGPNGAGKTTTIRILCGLLEPSSGAAIVDGIDVVKDAEGVKERIGYMSQKFALYNDLTVDENIRFYGDVYLVPRKRVAARRAFALHMAGLEGREKALTQTLPVGIKQRLALGCAVLHEPRVLFLDEPTAGVDPLSRRAFWRLIHTMRQQGVTVFVTTHYMDEAENCGTVAFIRAGRLVGLGSPRQLRERGDRGDLVRVRGVEREALQQNPRVRALTPMGAAWHLRLRAAGEADDLARELGVPVERIAPSLEDVFLDACEGNAEEKQP
ncbi:MAG: ABC transporter ATP-binding protein [Pseudomonadota bacterium]